MKNRVRPRAESGCVLTGRDSHVYAERKRDDRRKNRKIKR